MRTIGKREAAPPAAGGAADAEQRGSGVPPPQAGRNAVDRNLAARIAQLAATGMTTAEIAAELGVPEERVAAGDLGATDASPGGLRRADKVVADSFPASDPPPGPGA